MTGKTSKLNQDHSTPKEFVREPIAIIGIGCRYPGGVDSPDKFWSLLYDGTHAISEIPSSRIDLEKYYDPRPATPGKLMTRWGGFLENIDQFDASFFGIAPREAERLDPQQRLLLEVAWEALEDAGQLPEQLKGSRTGVFTGLWLNDFEARLFADPSQTDFYMTTGSGRYSAAGRVSYFLGLQGPSITIDTACSSSLVAVHLACQSLWTGESSLALAGGANVILQPHITIAYSQSKMMAPDGRCKFGDAQADGYVRSEGAALVVLKRLSEALEDGDSIYAVIRGSAVNNDGQSSGFLATPGQQGQEEMLRLSYRSAGVDPRQVQYVEAHGTGTRAGDPIELGALGAVLGKDRSSQTPLLVGSVKTNLGHTEGAAGIAGLIKVALALKNGAIPPSLHLKEFNPNIPWQDWKLTIPLTLTPWSDDEERIAGVSAFGIAGTNAHVVLAEAPKTTEQIIDQESESTYLLPLSAQTPEALTTLANSYLKYLREKDTLSLRNICYTASCRHTHHAERLAVTGKSHQEIAEQLSTCIAGRSYTPRNKIAGKSKVAFVFPGQGAQWLGMGRELLGQNSIFCEVLTKCDEAIKLWAKWSLLEQLSLDENAPGYRLNEISVIQPTLFAIEIALAAVWQSWGIEPSAVIGHSMGEVAAAYIAGALSLEEAAHVICMRSLLMQRTSGDGAMAVIGLPYREVEPLLHEHEGRLSIAVQNSPKSVVVSGDPDALEILMETFRNREVFCRLIKVDVASHSPQMDPIRPELVESLAEIRPQATTIPFYSTVTQNVCDGQTLDAEYWGRNLRQPVRFSETVERLLEDDHVVFIELSPHPILLSSIEEIRSGVDQSAYGFASLRRDQPERATMLGELSSLYALGYEVDWNKLYPNGGKSVSLPPYPWQREHYWFETTTPVKQSRPDAHPFLDQYIRSATGEHIWETTLSTKLFPYLVDHHVRGSIVFPAAAYVEMALAAASEIYNSKLCSIRDISFQEALFLPVEEERIIQLVLSSNTPEMADFQVYSRSPQNSSSDAWTLHTEGRIEIAPQLSAGKHIFPEEWQPGSEATAAEFYRAVADRGLEYGPNFQAITRLSQGQDGLIGKIKVPEEILSGAAKYHVHPAMIDACFQTLLFALPDVNQDPYLPIFLEEMVLFNAPSLNNELWCYVVPVISSNEVTGDIYLFNENKQIVFLARQLRLQRVEAKPENVRDLLYEIKWRESPIPYRDQTEQKHWLIFSDQHSTGEALAKNLLNDSQVCTLVFTGSEYRAIDNNHYEVDPLQPLHFQQLLKDVSQPIHGIAHLWSLDCDVAPSAADSNLLSILYLTQAIAQFDSATSPRVYFVTRGTQSVLAQPEPISVSQSSVWGMGAVIANEFPNLYCTRIDLDSRVMEGELELLTRALQANDEEAQIALRNRQRYVARLRPYQSSTGEEPENFFRQKVGVNQPFQVQVMSPGMLDSLSLKPILRRSPKAGEVEIAVKASGLNFMNVMAVMGMLPGYPNGIGPLGIECAGIVANVGAGVTDFQTGDEVAGIVFNSLSSHAIADARLIVKKPSYLSFEEAASIPIAYVTAYYALHSLGKLQANDRLLIHSASGGVGLAAIQLAKRAGAEIFATAGSVEKREYLLGMGIQQVMDSRALSFADEILENTRGEGIDLVLNSLAGNAITKGLQILKPYGRFLEIGKRDIYQNSKIGLWPFQKNLSYFAIDLDKMSRERPEVVGGMLRELFGMIERHELTPLPLQTFPVSQVSEAFRMMAQAKHIGKIVVTLEDSNASFEIPAGAISIHADGTYLITGGLGALGLTFAQWLARQGARHLILLGRSKPSETAQKVINELRDANVQVTAAQVDITDINQLVELFAQIKQTLPPLKGVVHAAGLLADGTIPQMDQERFMQAYAPKALGAWNLHTLTADQPLDFFIMFSSVAAILGTPGQLNYAAGNAYLDALARFRHALNLPALSVNWGPWSEIGLASEQKNRGARLNQQGLKSIAPSQGIEAISSLMTHRDPQVSVMRLDANKWCTAQPAAARSSLFKDLLSQTSHKENEQVQLTKSIRDELTAVASGKQRRTLFEAHVREQIAYVLHLASSRVALDKPLKTLGLDSLMSIELRNRLEDSLHIALSASLIWNYPTVRHLTDFLAEKIGVSFEKDGVTVEEPLKAKSKDSSEAEIERLSKAELDTLLREELDAIEDLLGDNENEQHA